MGHLDGQQDIKTRSTSDVRLPESPKLNSFGRRHSKEQAQDDAMEHQATPDSPFSSPPCLGCASCLSPDRTRRWLHSCCPGSPVYKCKRRGYQPSGTARLTLGLTIDSHRAPQAEMPRVPRVGGPAPSLGMEKPGCDRVILSYGAQVLHKWTGQGHGKTVTSGTLWMGRVKYPEILSRRGSIPRPPPQVRRHGCRNPGKDAHRRREAPGSVSRGHDPPFAIE